MTRKCILNLGNVSFITHKIILIKQKHESILKLELTDYARMGKISNYKPLLERIFNLASILGSPMVVDKERSPLLNLSGRFCF